MSEKISAGDYRTLIDAKPPRAQKYGAEATTVDGIRFDSKHEAARWAQLRLLERAGQISELRRQVALPLEGRDGPLKTRTGRAMRLTVDFAYLDHATGQTVYEDAKGMPTRDYEVRRAVAAAQGLEVIEV